MLEELAKRTAELANQVKGRETPEDRVLELDEPAGKEPEDIFAELDVKKKKQSNEEDLLDATIKPSNNVNTSDPAVNLIRDKLSKIYGKEPDAKVEAEESLSLERTRSKHQDFMYKLTTSGKSLADIQTEWHKYYVDLPNEEKHEVWQEFYKNQNVISQEAINKIEGDSHNEKKSHISPSKPKKMPASIVGNKSLGEIKNTIIDKVNAGGRLNKSDHAKSLLFGVGFAGLITLIVAFIFFNQVFIAPFISPSKTVSATPIIGNSEASIGPESKIIIPKINLEVPVVYGLKTVEEKSIQNALEDGVVHYAASPEPGEIGNSVIVGHSSNNILNSGKYKFAFVLLNRLNIEDTFFIHKDGVRYTYKIFDTKVVPPTDVSVLGPSDRENSITLITCDPPGTSINRLIVVAEQISPDPSGNEEADIEVESISEESLPSNAPSFWSRIINIF
jgi:sortase A